MRNRLEVFAFGPRLYTLLSEEGLLYAANIFEVLGTSALTLTNALVTLCVSSSPIFIPYLFMRYELSSVLGALKVLVAFYSAAIFLRAFGRITK